MVCRTGAWDCRAEDVDPGGSNGLGGATQCWGGCPLMRRTSPIGSIRGRSVALPRFRVWPRSLLASPCALPFLPWFARLALRRQGAVQLMGALFGYLRIIPV